MRTQRFGDHSHNRGTNGVFSSESERASDGRDDDDSVKQAGRGGGRRMRWRLLDRTASLLDMDTLAVFAPFKTILHAVKGNRCVRLLPQGRGRGGGESCIAQTRVSLLPILA